MQWCARARLLFALGVLTYAITWVFNDMNDGLQSPSDLEGALETLLPTLATLLHCPIQSPFIYMRLHARRPSAFGPNCKHTKLPVADVNCNIPNVDLFIDSILLSFFVVIRFCRINNNIAPYAKYPKKMLLIAFAQLHNITAQQSAISNCVIYRVSSCQLYNKLAQQFQSLSHCPSGRSK